MAQGNTSYVGLFRILPTSDIQNFTDGNIYASLGELKQLPYSDSLLQDIGEQQSVDLASVTTPIVVDLVTVDNTQTLQGLEGIAVPAKVWGDSFSVSTHTTYAKISLTHPFAGTSSQQISWDSYYDTVDKVEGAELWHGKVVPSYTNMNILSLAAGHPGHAFKVTGVISNESLAVEHFPKKSDFQNLVHTNHASYYQMSYNLGHKKNGTLVKGEEVGRELLNHVDRYFIDDTSLGWSALNGFTTIDHTNAETGGDYMRIEQVAQGGGTYTNPATWAVEYNPAQSWDVTYGGDLVKGTTVKITFRFKPLSGYNNTTMILVCLSGDGTNTTSAMVITPDGTYDAREQELIHTWDGPLTTLGSSAAFAFRSGNQHDIYADISEISIRPYKEHDFAGDKFIDGAGNVYDIEQVDPDQDGSLNKLKVTWDNSMATPTSTGNDWAIIDVSDEVAA